MAGTIFPPGKKEAWRWLTIFSCVLASGRPSHPAAHDQEAQTWRTPYKLPLPPYGALLAQPVHFDRPFFLSKSISHCPLPRHLPLGPPSQPKNHPLSPSSSPPAVGGAYEEGWKGNGRRRSHIETPVWKWIWQGSRGDSARGTTWGGAWSTASLQWAQAFASLLSLKPPPLPRHLRSSRVPQTGFKGYFAGNVLPLLEMVETLKGDPRALLDQRSRPGPLTTVTSRIFFLYLNLFIFRMLRHRMSILIIMYKYFTACQPLSGHKNKLKIGAYRRNEGFLFGVQEHFGCFSAVPIAGRVGASSPGIYKYG